MSYLRFTAALLLLLALNTGVSRADATDDARRELFSWFAGVETPRREAEKLTIKDVEGLDTKAHTGDLEPAEVLACYKTLKDRFTKGLADAVAFKAETAEIRDLNDLLTHYMKRKLDALVRCVADLEKDDKKAFAHDQLVFLMTDADNFLKMKDALVKRYAGTR